MSNQDNLQPATDIDPNVWYHITENVNDYNDDFKSMPQPWDDSRSRAFPIANGTTYWRFLRIGQRPERYALRCSEITNEKESLENRRIRACLQDSHGNDGQLWDIALWGHNTYRFINVANGSKYHLRVIPVAAYNAAFPNMPQPTTNPTTTTTSTTAIAYADSSNSHRKLSRGAIATIAIGSLLCVLAIAFLGYYMYIVAATLSRSLG